MWPRVLVGFALVTSITLAGCHTPETVPDEARDDNLTLQPEPEITVVRLLQVPDAAPSGEEVEVCWSVDGHGTIEHTDLHYASERSVEEDAGDPARMHDGNASAPDNATDDPAQGYELPGSFCALVPVGEEGVYVRAHAMNETPGAFSEQVRIRAEGDADNATRD